MADKFIPKKIDLDSINNGYRYGLEGIQPEAINAPIEAAAYAQNKALALEYRLESIYTELATKLDKAQHIKYFTSTTGTTQLSSENTRAVLILGILPINIEESDPSEFNEYNPLSNGDINLVGSGGELTIGEYRFYLNDGELGCEGENYTVFYMEILIDKILPYKSLKNT